MQGFVENALMLVCAGNAHRAGRDMTGFWPDAPTFKFMKVCEFRLPPESGNDKDDYPVVASNPLEFFQLQGANCRGYRLHHTVRKRQPSQQTDTPDRMLAGFVGGGPRFLIEAVGQFNSELWEPFHRLGDRNDPSRRIWLCTHILQAQIPATESEPVDLAVALSDLRTVLPEIEDYAREEKYDNFADCFANASKALASTAVEEFPWIVDIVKYTGFDTRQVNVLRAINHAWVFGGMGSWNDTGGGERYDALSERLYAALNDTIAGLANSTFRA